MTGDSVHTAITPTAAGKGDAPPFLRVKVCGVTRVEDALAAERAGADAVGFVFAPGSKRRISPEEATDLSAALGPLIARVGVFVDAPEADVERAIETAGLSAVQFHGQEAPAYVARFRQRVKVIRATAFRPNVTPESFTGYPADAVLLDASVPGSGRTFDWQQAAAWRAHPRMLLAGGLTPQNVALAVASLRPYGVDVSSGVESAPGVKSAELIHRFIRAARGEGATSPR